MEDIISIPKKHSDFTGFRICAKALDKYAENFSYVLNIKSTTITATDSRRLHRYVLQEFKPRGLFRVLRNNAGKVQIKLHENQSLGYPDIKPVLNENPLYTLTINRSEFTHALKQVRVLTTGYYKGVKLVIEKNRLTLDFVNPDLGDVIAERKAEYEGEILEIGCNVHYLLDVVDFMKSEKVSIGVSSDSRPLVFTGNEDKGLWCLITPMRI